MSDQKASPSYFVSFTATCRTVTPTFPMQLLEMSFFAVPTFATPQFRTSSPVWVGISAVFENAFMKRCDARAGETRRQSAICFFAEPIRKRLQRSKSANSAASPRIPLSHTFTLSAAHMMTTTPLSLYMTRRKSHLTRY